MSDTPKTMSVTLKRYAPKPGQPQDDKLATCWTCGYQWTRGTHGGHSCAQTLSHTVERLERELQQATDKAAHWEQQAKELFFKLSDAEHRIKELERNE